VNPNLDLHNETGFHSNRLFYGFDEEFINHKVDSYANGVRQLHFSEAQTVGSKETITIIFIKPTGTKYLTKDTHSRCRIE